MKIADIGFVRQGSREWASMWNKLAKEPINKGLEEPTVAFEPEWGEAWQYMGSHKAGRTWWHEFRHRLHPVANERVYVRIKANKSFKGG